MLETELETTALVPSSLNGALQCADQSYGADCNISSKYLWLNLRWLVVKALDKLGSYS